MSDPVAVADRRAAADTWRFVGRFLRAPTSTAALAPSSARLAELMISPIPHAGEPTVVELGAGLGAFTGAAQRVLAGRGHHVAIERHPGWAELLARRYPAVEVLCADAGDLPRLLAARGLRADVVISGLPWAAYWPDGGRPLLELVGEVLVADGAFTQFSYAWSRWSAPARRQHRELRDTFEETVVTRTVFANVPPAFVYLARRPRG